MYLINNATALRSISLCTTMLTVHTAFCKRDTQMRASAVKPQTEHHTEMPAWLPPCLPGSQGMLGRLPHIQGSSGVIISGSPQVTLRKLSVTPTERPVKEQRRGGRGKRTEEEEEEKGRGGGRSTVVQGTTG
ncbi:Hypothetical predicted protein [Xyrichtys novacula]|uniref:Uncharacterized protein n=1 Tax=Xyrichtys novacula TaxID=13765 RepID=A0AAV1FJG4_XYRNO|nr:Hypothetical predicted protein [Xyrichtys novacula]